MALKIKMGSFSALIRHLFLVILLCLWPQKQKWQVSVTLFDFLELCFRFFYFVSDFKIKTASFYALIRHLFLVILLDLWAIKFETWISWDFCKNFVFASFTSFMASKTKTVSFYGMLRSLFLVLVYGFNFQQGKFL